jgi:hypothetical protein
MPKQKSGESHNKTTTDKLIHKFIHHDKQAKPDRNEITKCAMKLALWPYSERSCLIDIDTARSIRAWALQKMTVAQLHSLSQRQLLGMYLDHLTERLAKVRPEMNDPDVQAWSQAKAEAMFADMKRRGSDVPDLMGVLNAH